MNKRKYQICKKTIMDTSDPNIIFDNDGICDHYWKAKKELDYFQSIDKEKALEELCSTIKKNKKYDCIIGLSGGIDSAYLLYCMVKQYGINPLVVHIDGGWNTEISQWNVENLVKKLDVDLFTYVVNWKEMRDLQLSFLKSNTANQDIPQDHAFFAKLYDITIKNNIKYVLTGGNLVSESILPSSLGYIAMDKKFLKSVHRKYGKVRLKSFPTMSFLKYYLSIPYIHRIKIVRPLDLLQYDPEEAKSILMQEVGFKDYGKKHNESSFTKFFQNYYLYEKFGMDKRRSHLSSLIVSGKMSRDEALEAVKVIPYDINAIRNEKEFIAKKLKMSVEELDKLIAMPNKSYKDFSNNSYLYKVKDKIKKHLLG